MPFIIFEFTSKLISLEEKNILSSELMDSELIQNEVGIPLFDTTENPFTVYILLSFNIKFPFRVKYVLFVSLSKT